MRITLVANTTWNIYNFRLNVIDKLLQEGHEVHVIAPVDEYISYKENYPSVKHYNLRTMDRDSTNPIKDLLLIGELMRKYRKINPDLIIHYTNKVNIFGGIAAKLTGKKSVAMITGLGYAFIHKGWIRDITTTLYRRTASIHKRFIFENIEDRELFERSKIIKKGQGVSIKGCGVDTSHYKPYPNGNLKEKGELVFTFIGRLLYDKGIREFVAAAMILREEFPTIRFWIVGELDPQNPATVDRDDLNKWVENDIVRYHGFQKDVRPFIADSDCVVLPSYREAIPRTITEAMSMGKAVITTDVAGCREAVDVGVNGYLAEVRSVSSLVNTIKAYINLSPQARHDMGYAGRQKALEEFDDKKIAQHIYDEIEPFLDV